MRATTGSSGGNSAADEQTLIEHATVFFQSVRKVAGMTRAVFESERRDFRRDLKVGLGKLTRLTMERCVQSRLRASLAFGRSPAGNVTDSPTYIARAPLFIPPVLPFFTSPISRGPERPCRPTRTAPRSLLRSTASTRIRRQRQRPQSSLRRLTRRLPLNRAARERACVRSPLDDRDQPSEVRVAHSLRLRGPMCLAKYRSRRQGLDQVPSFPVTEVAVRVLIGRSAAALDNAALAAAQAEDAARRASPSKDPRIDGPSACPLF